MGQVSTEVIKTVARLKGVAPEDLSPQLYQVVDPDALDTLFETDSVQLSFTFAGYRVTVQGEGDIQADPLISPATSPAGHSGERND